MKKSVEEVGALCAEARKMVAERYMYVKFDLTVISPVDTVIEPPTSPD